VPGDRDGEIAFGHKIHVGCGTGDRQGDAAGDRPASGLSSANSMASPKRSLPYSSHHNERSQKRFDVPGLFV
jgi:hypothetical protein